MGLGLVLSLGIEQSVNWFLLRLPFLCLCHGGDSDTNSTQTRHPRYEGTAKTAGRGASRGRDGDRLFYFCRSKSAKGQENTKHHTT